MQTNRLPSAKLWSTSIWCIVQLRKTERLFVTFFFHGIAQTLNYTKETLNLFMPCSHGAQMLMSPSRTDELSCFQSQPFSQFLHLCPQLAVLSSLV